MRVIQDEGIRNGREESLRTLLSEQSQVPTKSEQIGIICTRLARYRQEPTSQLTDRDYVVEKNNIVDGLKSLILDLTYFFQNLKEMTEQSLNIICRQVINVIYKMGNVIINGSGNVLYDSSKDTELQARLQHHEKSIERLDQRVTVLEDSRIGVVKLDVLCNIQSYGDGFVGREDNLAEIKSVFEAHQHRIKTVVAMGGAGHGKSRFAAQFADLHRSDRSLYPSGVVWIGAETHATAQGTIDWLKQATRWWKVRFALRC